MFKYRKASGYRLISLMKRLLMASALLCFSVAMYAESYVCETVSLLSSTPESATSDYNYPIFIVDVERGVSRLGEKKKLEKFAGFCEFDKTESVIQCQKIVTVSGKWLFNVDLSNLTFTYSQGYINGRLEVVSYSGTCLKE